MQISVTSSPTEADINAVSDGLDAYNQEVHSAYGRQPLAVLVRDPGTNEVIGGLTGRTSLGVLFIDMFYLPKSLRGQGLGGTILRKAEDEARRRGCQAGVLYTITFQAPDFYAKHGWRAFGEVPSTPPGASRVFMTKDLA
jgi:GNAT superfamily N-acetyltransferase